MRKTDKKIDNKLRSLLTDVCEQALKDIDGFQWLTHMVNYDNYPDSLKIICVFDTNENLKSYLQSDNKQTLIRLIESVFQSLDIKPKRMVDHIAYDSEENCHQLHQGNWARRLH